jgi:hypothetical protein
MAHLSASKDDLTETNGDSRPGTPFHMGQLEGVLQNAECSLGFSSPPKVSFDSGSGVKNIPCRLFLEFSNLSRLI